MPDPTIPALTAAAEWVIRINLGDVDGISADDWLQFIMEAVIGREPGFSGLVSMMQEPVDG
jgi:hypothetical protein